MIKERWHFFKFETQNGWKTYFNINTNRLRRLIPNLKPKNCYISVNKFLNYKEHNATYKFQNKIMFRYGLIDIDSQDFSSKKEAINYFNEIILFLQKKKIRISEINATNIYGGFQIIIHQQSYKRFKYILTASLLRDEKLFKRIDWRVFDDNRVRRYAPSWNGNKNSWSIPLFSEPNLLENHPQRNGLSGWVSNQPKDLNSYVSNERIVMDFFDFRKLSPFSTAKSGGFHNEVPAMRQKTNGGFNTLGMPQIIQRDGRCENTGLNSNRSDSLSSKDYFEADDNEVVENNTPPSEQRQGKTSRANLPCHFLVKQISNSVYGSPNNYVPVLKFPIKPSLKRIRRLQRAYNIGNLLLFQNHIGFVAISPKAFQKERLEKIYKKAGCWKSLSELEKYKNQWIYVSSIWDIDKSQKIDTFKFLGMIENDTNGSYSRPHLYWLNKFVKKQYLNQIGTEKPRLYIAHFSTI